MLTSHLRLPVDLLGTEAADVPIREAAWVARCVGRGDIAPLGAEDIAALADTLKHGTLKAGQVLFTAGTPQHSVFIIRGGHVELVVGAGRRRVVVQVLRPGDVEGDIHLLLGMPPPYTARALEDSTYLVLRADSFESLVQRRPAIARRWLSSVAARLAGSQGRILKLLGRPLSQQVAQLLLDEGDTGEVPFPQRTLAAMLGVQRPSLNKLLKEFEQRGLISIFYGGIRILDQPGLRRRAG